MLSMVLACGDAGALEVVEGGQDHLLGPVELAGAQEGVTVVVLDAGQGDADAATDVAVGAGEADGAVEVVEGLADVAETETARRQAVVDVGQSGQGEDAVRAERAAR